MLQGAADWGARRGGALGSAVLNGAAGLNAAAEVSGVNDLGRAIGEGNALGVGVALAGMLPVGRVASKADNAAGLILKYLGDDATAMVNETGDLILQAKNGLREVRFDVNKTHPHKSPHVHVIEYKQVKNQKVEVYNKRVYPADVPAE
jgi:hypothetical protein